MKRILYVVHRYAPFPGGSENYVRDMAEETLSRGHEVAVFTGEHQGDWNGVKVTSEPNVLLEKWDLIVVHGGDVGLQDFVLNNISKIPSPVLFMLIRPSTSLTYMNAMRETSFIACSTIEDWEFVKKMGVENKSVQVSHGIDAKGSLAKNKINFREKYGIKTDYMWLSSGGFWPNKAFHELIGVFKEVGRKDVTLVLTGYDNRHGIMPKEEDNLRVMMLDDRSEVLDAISGADLYIMHSHSEGFGLVLLESMLNKTPWAARNIAGSKLMKDYGFTYDNDAELIKFLSEFKSAHDDVLANNFLFVNNNHLIKNTVDDILKTL
jgi:glycosyltransferase involved in cell wall biosynthesis